MKERANISAIAGLYRLKEGRMNLLGSGFVFASPEVIVTAAHCVQGVPKEEIRINHFGGTPPTLLSTAEEILMESEGDVAVIRIQPDQQTVQWVTPFQRLQYVADFGEPICAFGYPEEMDGGARAKPQLRFFRGFVQRPFGYAAPGKRSYSAFELSFPAPAGLSGAPVFLESEPSIVVGIVTENFETYSVVDEYEQQRGSREKVETEVRRVIRYGVAVNAQYLVALYENATGMQVPARTNFGSHA